MRRILACNGIAADDSRLAALSAEKSRLARAWIAERNPVDPDAPATLFALRQAYRLALASSASKGTVDLFLESNGLRPLFDCVLDGSDVRAAKPAPDIYQLCCARLNLTPADCLVVEDAVNGIEAAKAAGAEVWALPTTCSVDQLTAAGADRILDNLRGLLPLLEPA
jgi:HAD superfamily hydrolase (TIGR01509 family)